MTKIVRSLHSGVIAVDCGLCAIGEVLGRITYFAERKAALLLARSLNKAAGIRTRNAARLLDAQTAHLEDAKRELNAAKADHKQAQNDAKALNQEAYVLSTTYS